MFFFFNWPKTMRQTMEIVIVVFTSVRCRYSISSSPVYRVVDGISRKGQNE